MAEHLEAVLLGQINRLIINVPPRTMKSTISTVTFPTWIWGPKNVPQKRFLFGSYAESLARKHSLYRRNLINSDWYQTKWADRFSLSGDQNVKTDYSNDKTGQMKSAGILGSVTGEGADIIVLDDPHDPLGAESDADRESIIQAIDLTWSSRLNDKKTGAIVVVMQRLHEQDATGHLLQKGGWTHLCLRQISEDKERHVFPVSGRIKSREPGELLHPSRDGEKEIEAVRRDLGEFGFAAQQQQNPVPKTGGIVKAQWIKYYRSLPEHLTGWTISADLTFKDAKASDFTVIQLWARVDADRYLIDQIRDRMRFTDAIRAFELMVSKYPQAMRKLVEEKANGAALIDTLKSKIEGIIPVNPTESKSARLEDCAVLFESGNVYFPHPDRCDWIPVNERELLSFGKTKHDDTVDAMTQYLNDSKGKLAQINRLDRLLTM
jgi:predicted phage terminase large subunit-like protein